MANPSEYEKGFWLCALVAAVAMIVAIAAWHPFGTKPVSAEPAYDPLAYALAHPEVDNPEATVPSMCYTKTGGVSNPCWTCHTDSISPNDQSDWQLQKEYAFSKFALQNRWHNLFTNRQAKAAAISDETALSWIRQDNYSPLRAALAQLPNYPGFKPDLDFTQGFDADGFAKDGSGWRALRYKPFLGTFWPTNGSTDDVFIRLPEKFGRDAQGKASRDVLKLNYSILEAVIRGDPLTPHGQGAKLATEVEPVNEACGGLDLDGDGKYSVVSIIMGLPTRFVGGAARVKVERYKYPEGTEFLHSVRYVDPDAPSMIAARMKELRYMKKVRFYDAWGTQRAYEREFNEKSEGVLPAFAGGPEVGLLNAFGWQLQGFIEDEKGRLRLQSKQEQTFCMGCHSSIGVTVDQTFSFARKLPGKAGWAYQDVRGMHDAPQVGHAEPEILTYFKRVQGGDEFRANEEMIERFFPEGTLDETAVRRAAKGGDKDITWLIAPSRARALALNKAYMALVATQRFDLGRDTLLAPPGNVHAVIENGETELGKANKVYRDGRLWLDWGR